MPPTTTSADPANASPQRLRLSIDIYEDDIVVTQHSRDKGQERRVVTLSQLQRLLDHAAEGEQDISSLIPYADGVEAVGYCGGVWRWLVRRPAQQTTMRVETVRKGTAKTQSYTFECPALLAELTGSISDTGRVRWKHVESVYAVANKPLTPATPLYACPTLNVQSGHAHMCNVNMAAVAGMAPLEAFETAFFGSLFVGLGAASMLTPTAVQQHGNLLKLIKKEHRVRLTDLKREGVLSERYSFCG